MTQSDRITTTSDTQTDAQSLTHDAALGLAINQQVYIQKIRHDQLGKALGLSKSTISRKLRGLVPWSAEEVSLTAAFLGLDAANLMPSPDGHGGWMPASFVLPQHAPAMAKAPAVAGALVEPPERIELSTYSLRVNRSAD